MMEPLDKNIKILYISSSGSMGGAETSLYNLVTKLNKDRYIPFVICPRCGTLVENLQSQSISVGVIPLPSWRKLKSIFSRSFSLKKLIKYAKAHNIDIVHSNSIWVNHYAQKIGKELNIPVICHLRDIIKREQVRKYKLHKVDMIIPISDAVRKPLDEFGIDNERIKRIYNGVDLSLFSNNEDVLKKEYSINGYLVGIVGQLNPRSQWKGQREFILAASEVCKKMDNVYFAIVGDDDSPKSDPRHGSYIHELRMLAKDLGIDDHLIFTGYRKDIPDIMASFDVLVSASYAEPFGRVIIEAMAAGKPVIGTNAGGAPEIIEHGITGIIVPPKDHRSLSEAITYLLQREELRKNMGEAGRRRVNEYFSLEKNVERIQNIYEDFVRSLFKPFVKSCDAD